jgi:hypothetical protein
VVLRRGATRDAGESRIAGARGAREVGRMGAGDKREALGSKGLVMVVCLKTSTEAVYSYHERGFRDLFEDTASSSGRLGVHLRTGGRERIADSRAQEGAVLSL